VNLIKLADLLAYFQTSDLVSNGIQSRDWK